MYLFDPIQPTELFHERQEAVMRDARLAHERAPDGVVARASDRVVGAGERPVLEGVGDLG
jgi:hypothetical protein